MAKIQPDEIAELKTKMQALIFSIEDGIVMTDFAGNILVINDRAKSILGIEKRYPYDKKFLDYIPYPEAKEKLKALLSSEEPTSSDEILIDNTKEERVFHTTRNAVTTAKGQALGKVIALHDITAEKHLERLKDDFVHSITHDLKSPLTSVQGFLRLFMDGELGKMGTDQLRYMGIMMHSTEKLLRMINNILDMAKLEAGKMSVSKIEWDVLITVNEIIQSLEEIAKHHKIKLFKTVFAHRGNKVVEVTEGGKNSNGRISTMADPVLFERVITNLVDNALKFTPAGGQIEVKVEDFSDKIQVSVKDNGRGIPEDSLDKLFQKFQQVPGTKGGTGLGLTISRHIVEAHGGKINVTSQKDHGSVFSFWIPKTRAEKHLTKA